MGWSYPSNSRWLTVGEHEHTSHGLGQRVLPSRHCRPTFVMCSLLLDLPAPLPAAPLVRLPRSQPPPAAPPGPKPKQKKNFWGGMDLKKCADCNQNVRNMHKNVEKYAKTTEFYELKNAFSNPRSIYQETIISELLKGFGYSDMTQMHTKFSRGEFFFKKKKSAQSLPMLRLTDLQKQRAGSSLSKEKPAVQMLCTMRINLVYE